jgi:hypothetical protein
MEKHGEEIRETEIEASGGAKLGVMRYVLAISILLAIVALSIIWITGTQFV